MKLIYAIRNATYPKQWLHRSVFWACFCSTRYNLRGLTQQVLKERNTRTVRTSTYILTNTGKLTHIINRRILHTYSPHDSDHATGLNDRIRGSISSRRRDLSSFNSVQASSGARPATYSMCTDILPSGLKRSGVWS